MNNQNTTAVRSPISGQAEEPEKNSQPAPKPSSDGAKSHTRGLSPGMKTSGSGRLLGMALILIGLAINTLPVERLWRRG